MADILRANNKLITIEDIQKKVSEHFSIKMSDMFSARRSKSVVIPRQVAMYLLREETPMILKAIGSLLGGRDHSTVLYGHDRVAALIDSDYGLQSDIKKIRKNLISQDDPKNG